MDLASTPVRSPYLRTTFIWSRSKYIRNRAWPQQSRTKEKSIPVLIVSVIGAEYASCRLVFAPSSIRRSAIGTLIPSIFVSCRTPSLSVSPSSLSGLAAVRRTNLSTVSVGKEEGQCASAQARRAAGKDGDRETEGQGDQEAQRGAIDVGGHDIVLPDTQDQVEGDPDIGAGEREDRNFRSAFAGASPVMQEHPGHAPIARCDDRPANSRTANTNRWRP
jgi:hypothetical protein